MRHAKELIFFVNTSVDVCFSLKAKQKSFPMVKMYAIDSSEKEKKITLVECSDPKWPRHCCKLLKFPFLLMKKGSDPIEKKKITVETRQHVDRP